jgi:hypothetical protein
MKRLIASVLILSLFPVGLIGCTKNESTNTKETELKTPAGTTTITSEKDVKKTGDNSPSTNP